MSLANIPDHLREELDWLNAYFLLVKHDNSQAPERAVEQAKAAAATAAAAAAANTPDSSALLAKPTTTTNNDNTTLTSSPSTAKTMAATAAVASPTPAPAPHEDEPMPFSTFHLHHTSTTTTTAASETPILPIPLGKPRGGEPLYIPRLYQLAQSRGLAPHFTFDEDPPQSFSVRLLLGDVLVTHPGPFRNKKDAKEAVAEKGFLALSAAPELGVLARPCEPGVDGPPEPWVGILNRA
jgi:hypothetical protein